MQLSWIAELKQRAVAKANSAHAPLVEIVAKDEVGDSRVLGSCAGGTKRVVLVSSAKKSATTQAVPAAIPVATGPTAPGRHESEGPSVCVTLVHFPANVPEPVCDGGSRTDDDILGTFAKLPIPVVTELPKYLNDHGWGNQRHQNFAECSLICAAVPKGAIYDDSTTHVLFDLTGSGAPPTNGMGKEDEGRWGPGAEGFWRIDPGLIVKTAGDKQLVCKRARNWSDSHSRSFRLVVDYRMGDSTQPNPTEVDNGWVKCEAPH